MVFTRFPEALKDGDFAMIWGYPGSTNRYESSYGITLATDINNPTLVKLRDVRLKYMFEEMKKDPAVKLKLASSYAGIANYWKFYDGETKQLIKYDILGQKKVFEEKFQAWAKNKPEYATILADWAKAYEAWRPYAKHRVNMIEGVFGSPLIGFASSLLQLEAALVKTGATQADVKKAMDAASQQRKSFLEGEDIPSDRQIVAAITQLFFTDVPKEQHPIGFFGGIKDKYGPLDDDATYKKYAADIFSNTMILDNARWEAFAAKPDAVTLQSERPFILPVASIPTIAANIFPCTSSSRRRMQNMVACT
jgi:Peptidase S46.